MGDVEDATLPTVMISWLDGELLLAKIDESGECRFEVVFTTGKSTQELWEASPWYNASDGTASSSAAARIHAISCGVHGHGGAQKSGGLELVGDDTWLYEKWLRNIPSCVEIAAPQSSPSPSPSPSSSIPVWVDVEESLSSSSSSSPAEASRLPRVDINEEAAVVRLPQYDNTERYPLEDPLLLNDDGRSLTGLNSNSHAFPYQSRNTYPRRFQSFVLEVRDACVDLDGLVTTERDGGGEYHPGGCGCCPLGTGALEIVRHSARPARVHHRRLVTLVQRFQDVYYHFLLEVLPRLLQVLERVRRDPELMVLVDMSGGAYVEELLVDVLGLPRERLVPYSPENVYCADLLLVPAPLPCGHAPRAITLALRGTLLPLLGLRDEDEDDSAGGVAAAAAAITNVLVMQREGARRIANHGELLSALRRRFPSAEFGAFSSERRSVREQAAAFHAADVVIAPHGSGISNILFMRPGAVLVELLPWEYPNLTFYLVSTALEIRHLIYAVDESNAYGPMRVDAEAFCRALERVGVLVAAARAGTGRRRR